MNKRSELNEKYDASMHARKSNFFLNLDYENCPSSNNHQIENVEEEKITWLWKRETATKDFPTNRKCVPLTNGNSNAITIITTSWFIDYFD